MVPGHNLLASAGPTRNVLSVAEALSRWADVTVAFRRVLEPTGLRAFHVTEIAPGSTRSTACVDDAAVRGIGYRDFISYLRAIRRFLMKELDSYDLVLEKSWLLSGYVAAHCHKTGKPAALVENIVSVPAGSPRNLSEIRKHVRLSVAGLLAGRYIRKTPLVIAETEELKRALVLRWKIPASKVHVIGLGVDRNLFHPIAQDEARRTLGIPPNKTILLYAGVLDQTHDLAPLLDALSASPDPSLELHIAGDGTLRGLYEEKSGKSPARIVFHGRVPYEAMPTYIAAADLCVAPYDLTMFPYGEVAYSTLKIPEYLAGGRPVASVPSGHIRELVKPGVTGFLFPNLVEDWLDFIGSMPSRRRLKEMGEAALRESSFRSWEDTALEYLSLCEREVLKSKETGHTISTGNHGPINRNEVSTSDD